MHIRMPGSQPSCRAQCRLPAAGPAIFRKKVGYPYMDIHIWISYMDIIYGYHVWKHNINVVLAPNIISIVITSCKVDE